MTRVLSEGGGWLSPEETEALLDCYGIPLVETVRVVTPEEAGRAAAELEREVALKAVVPGLVLTEGQGVSVVDVRVRVGETRPPLPVGAKRR